MFEHVLNVFKGSSNDKIVEVRKTVYEAVAKILNGFSISNLRNFETDLLLILLNGLSDESQEVVVMCQKLLEEVGINRKKLDE